MNKLETRFLAFIQHGLPKVIYHPQAITLKLANGLRYTPDFFSFNYPLGVTAFEVKGEWVDGDSFPKLKMAATVFPHINFELWWEIEGVWQKQLLKP